MFLKRLILLSLLAIPCAAAQTSHLYPLDPKLWGVPYDSPTMKRVEVAREVIEVRQAVGTERPDSGQASAPQDLALRSYQKARSIMDRSVTAYGGIEALRSVKNFSVKTEVEQFHRNQSRKPEIAEATLGRGEIIVDFRDNRYRYDVERGVIGGNRVESYEIFDGKDGIFVDVTRRTKRPRPPSPNWREGFTARVLPQILLLNAVARSSGLRYVGRVIYDERPHEIISFANVDGGLVTLFVDQSTNLISKQESLIGDTVVGD
jgi:hypothetical protein